MFVRLMSVLAAVMGLTACEVSSNSAKKKQDTTTLPATISVDTSAVNRAAGGVPAVPSDSATRAGAPQDSGVVELFPVSPRRGGVIVALARGLTVESPHCSWRGAPLPCYATAAGVQAVIGLPADDSAGSFTLTIDRPSSRISRQITVADHDFGRELIFLDSGLYALVTKGRDIARDARAMHQVLAGETAERRWNGSWRQPVSGGKSSVYGIERFYFRASDSARAVTIDANMRSRGAFGSDTNVAKPTDVPSWRHAGIDIGVPKATQVRAPAGGQVADVGDYVLSGRTLTLDHGQGIHTVYFHLDTVLVKKGEIVREGAVIGRVDATGLATAPHLHFGVYVHGKNVDPAAWLRALPAVRNDSTGGGTMHP